MSEVYHHLREVLDHWDALCTAEGLHDEDGTPKIAELRSAALKLFVAELKKEHP